MSSNINKFEQALKNTLNDEISVTENLACGYKTSGAKLLDINFAVSSLRSKSDGDIAKMFSEAFYENPLLAVKWLFMLRDIRGNGMGERRSFRVCFKWLATVRPELVQKLVKLVSEYGRFDDLFCLVTMKNGDKVNDEVLAVIDEQWADDVKNMKDGKPISLLAKWMPSVNTSSDATVKLAKYFCKELSLSEKQYRKTLSAMRKYLNVIEQKMSAKEWNAIDYEAVPSKANIKYNAAFLRNDESRRREFLGKLEKGEAKINSSANFPCDIVHAYAGKVGYDYYSRSSRYTVDPALEAMWKALPDYVKDLDNGSTIVVADGSGSMCCRVGSGSMTALEVANSLAIYFAEKLNGEFKNKYITFSERPQYVDFSNAKSLAEKIGIALEHDECANTNVEAVFDLLLESAKRNQLKKDDIPANILIVSDMEFDQGTSWSGCGYSYYDRVNKYSAKRNALFESIKNKWQSAGYKLPRLIYWNVNSRTGTIPLTQNEMGVALVSGFSPAIANMVFSAKLDPYEVLVDAINSPRYDAVEAAIKEIV